MTKQCNKCNQAKSLDRFYKKVSNVTDGLSGRCKKCDNLLKNDWRKNNPEKVKAYENGRYRSTDKKRKDIARSREQRVRMSTPYIRELMTKKTKNLDPKDIPDDLIEVHKVNLMVKRILRSKKLKGE